MATTENGTYYPGDYTLEADVPGDMKKMAESIDANKVQKIEGKGLSTEDFTKEYKQKLDDLENYDDTEIKEEIESLKTDNTTNKSNIEELQEDNTQNKSDISDIKEEQATQNANIENLQENDATQDELIYKLKSALINVETEEAKSLHIEDASEVPAQLSVAGNQEQETREGYNLLDINKGVISNDCTMTQISKSEYKITVNNNADWARIDIPISLLSTKTYRASIYTKVSNANARIEIGTYKDNTQYGSKLSNNSTDYKKQIIDNVETNINRFVIWLNPDSVSEEFEVYIKELMLYEGSEEKEYEPYGAMPSPKFPSAIKCLGSNKNIYPGWEHGTVSQETGNLQNDSKYIRSVDFIPVLPNVNYCLKAYDLENISMLNTTVRMYDANKQYLGNQHVGNIQSTEQTFTITNTNVRYIKPVHLNSTDIPDTAKANIKLEEGTEATSYSLFEQGSTEIKKINKNFLISKEIDTTINGVKIVCNNGVLTLDGKATGSVSFDFNVFSLKKGIYKNTRGVVSGKATGSFQNYLRNEDGSYFIKQNESFELQEEKKLKYRFFANPNSVFEKYTMIPQVEKGLVSTTPETHKEKSKILPIQQEMLEGDYFVKEADGWKEVHNYSKEIFDGTEQFTVSSLKNTRMVLPIANAKQNPDEILAVSNSFLGVTYNQVQENKLINAICVNNGYLLIDTDGITNVSEFKQTLADKYNAGNPVYIYYKEATPTKLPCTPEQSAVLEELSNLDLFDGVNNIITAENIAKMKLYYIANAKKYIDKETSNIKEQLNTINELLSTTATSSLLLDNLQNDLESEVM